MSDTKSTSVKSDTKTETKSGSKPAETSAPASGDSAGKSAKESVGGAAVGHYGYFSNVKTPEYKSGWDDIWGKKKASGGKRKAAKKAAPRKAPVTVGIDFDDLPEEIRDGLAAAIRDQLKKKRVPYDARAKKGEVAWTIKCEVGR